MNELQIFNSEEFGQVRTIVIDGEPWFVGRDIAASLGYSDPTGAVRKRVDEEDKGVAKMDTPSGRQEVVIINESGLYTLILGSKLESSKRFKRWVTAEVLPSIRKTGTYTNIPVQSLEIPIGEVASYLKVLDRAAVRQNTASHKIMEAFVMVSEQFGIHLPAGFVKTPEYEQMALPLRKAGEVA